MGKANAADDRAPVVYERRGRWYADLRYWGGGRWVLRDPTDPHWRPGRRVGRKAESKREALLWAELYVQALESAPKTMDERELSDVVEEYMVYRDRILPRSVAPESRRRRLRGMRTGLNHLLDDFRGKPMCEVDPQRTVDRLIREGVSVASVRTYAGGHIGPFLTWSGLDVPKLKVPKPEKDQRKHGLTDPQIADVRRAAERHGVLLAIDLGLFAGLRSQEIFGARWEDIDEARRVIKIVRQADGSLPKHDTVRDVPLLPEWEHWPNGRTGPICEGYGRTGAQHSRARVAVRAVMAEAGVYRYGRAWHVFRHTYARILLQRTLRMLLLKDALGHRDVQTTQKYYLHVLPSTTADKAVELLYPD